MQDCIMKLVPLIDALMPLIVLIIAGCWLNGKIEKLKSRLQLDHSIIEKRAGIYAEIQDDLNNIYSYLKRAKKRKSGGKSGTDHGFLWQCMGEVEKSLNILKLSEWKNLNV